MCRRVHNQFFGCALALALTAAFALTAVVAGAPPAHARQNADFSIVAEVDGDRVSVSIAELSEPIGSLQLVLSGVPDLATEECVVVSGLGACAQTDDEVRIVALNTTGWQEPALLVDLEFDGDVSGAELVLERGTDVQGTDLVGTAAVVTAGAATSGSGGGSSEDSGAGLWIVVGVVAVVVLGLLAFGAAKRRSAQQD